MAKDLPYFKFFCSEWNDGKITLEDYKTQGVFINVCSYYWSNECELTTKILMKKFRNNKEDLELLISEGFILDKKGVVCIKFLDEQKKERIKTNKARSIGGKASAKARREKKESEQMLNSSSTNDEQMLNSSSTKSHVIREEEKRKEEIRKEKRGINSFNREEVKKQLLSEVNLKHLAATLEKGVTLNGGNFKLYPDTVGRIKSQFNNFMRVLSLKDMMFTDINHIKNYFRIFLEKYWNVTESEHVVNKMNREFRKQNYRK